MKKFLMVVFCSFFQQILSTVKVDTTKANVMRSSRPRKSYTSRPLTGNNNVNEDNDIIEVKKEIVPKTNIFDSFFSKISFWYTQCIQWGSQWVKKLTAKSVLTVTRAFSYMKNRVVETKNVVKEKVTRTVEWAEEIEKEDHN